MKRKLILFIITVLMLIIIGITLHRNSSVDTVTSATRKSKSNKTTLINKVYSSKNLAEKESKFVILDGEFPTDLDPVHEENGRFTLQYGIGETLVLLDNKYCLKPLIAQSWENIDSLTWKIKLRTDVKFQNGVHMTAASVKQSLERSIRLNDEASKLLPISSIEDDDFMLVIKTSTPCPALIQNLSNPLFIIVDTSSENKEHFSYFPVCTGPFIPVSFDTSGFEVALKRFDNYYGGTPVISDITIRLETDTEKLIKNIQQYQIDCAVNAPLESLSLFRNSKYNSQIMSTNTAQLLMINIENKFLSDRSVRRAIALAIDSNEEKNIFSHLLSLPDTSENNQYDPKMAKQLLKKSGYEDRDGDGIVEKNNKSLSLSLAVCKEETALVKKVDLLKKQLNGVGIGVHIRIYNKVFFDSRERYGKFDMLIFTAPVDENGNAQSFIDGYFHSNGSFNYGKYKNPNTDKLIDIFRTEFDIDKRIILMEQIQNLVLREDVSFVFLGYQKSNIITKNSVSGMDVHPDYRYRLTAETSVNP